MNKKNLINSNRKISREDFEKVKYTSQVEEHRRYIRIRHKIKTKYKSKKEAFGVLMDLLKKLYNAPNKDFSKKGTSFMINKTSFKIMDYKYGDIFFIESYTKNTLYGITYKIKVNRINKKCNIIYYDFSKSLRTVFGFKENAARMIYKRNVKKNKRALSKELKKYEREIYNEKI